MNPEQSAAHAAKLRLLLLIVDAHARGEKIEYRAKNGKEWSACLDPVWAVVESAGEYRIKPQPRTFYAIQFKDGSTFTYESKEVRDRAMYPSFGDKALDLIEVLK